MQKATSEALSSALFSSAHVPNAHDEPLLAKLRQSAKSEHGPLITYSCQEPGETCSEMDFFADENNDVAETGGLPEENGMDVQEDDDDDDEDEGAPQTGKKRREFAELPDLDTERSDDEEEKQENSFTSFVFICSLDVMTKGKYLTNDGTFTDTPASGAVGPLDEYYWRIVHNEADATAPQYVKMRARLQRFEVELVRKIRHFFGATGPFEIIFNVLNTAASVTHKPYSGAKKSILGDKGGAGGLRVCTVKYQKMNDTVKPRRLLVHASQFDTLNAAFILINFRYFCQMQAVAAIEMLRPKLSPDTTLFEAAEALLEHKTFYSNLFATYVAVCRKLELDAAARRSH